MKRISMLIASLLIAAPVFPQEIQQGTKSGDLHKFELSFNPFSWSRVGDATTYGFSSGFAYHFTKGFAIATDIGVNKTWNGSDDVEIAAARVGPRFTMRDGKTSVFGQVLLGGALIRYLGPRINGYRPSEGDYWYSGALSGGVDIGARDWLSFRIIQAEYTAFYLSPDYAHGARVSTGLVFHLQ